jgi:hypothetical protein
MTGKLGTAIDRLSKGLAALQTNPYAIPIASLLALLAFIAKLHEYTEALGLRIVAICFLVIAAAWAVISWIARKESPFDRSVRTPKYDRSVRYFSVGGLLFAAVLLIGAFTAGKDKYPKDAAQVNWTVRVTEPGNDYRHDLMLHQNNALPLRAGDIVNYVVEATPRPLYLYIVYFNCDGTVTPLHPWTNTKWKPVPKEEPRTQFVQQIDISPDCSGVEALVLFARTTPLADGVKLDELIGKLPPQPELTDEDTLAWFANGELQKDGAGNRAPRVRFNKPDDPVGRIRSILLGHQLRTSFPWTRAVCFAVRGKEKP